MTIRMGYWDCPSCNAKKNLGPNPTCASCGRPRGANVPFYTDDAAPEVEDPELVARARAGADWRCKYCGADNRAGVMDCAQCGAGPDGAVRREVKVTLDQAPKPKSRVGVLVAAVVGVLALVLSLVWFFFIRTTELVVTVDSVAWVKSANVEALETSRGEGWSDQVPSEARTVRTEQRSRTKHVQDGTIKVKVGKKDLGNGMFEDIYQDKPKMVDKEVEDAWVTYDVDKWVVREKLEKRSSDGTEPDDPAAGKVPSSTVRIADRKSMIVLELRGSNGKSYTYELDATSADAPKKFERGKRYKAKINGTGSVVSLGP